VLAAGDDKVSAATYAYTHLSFAMLIGTLVTIAGFVPIGFAQSSAGEYTFSIFAVFGIALLASWFVAMVFAPLLGLVLLRPPKSGADDKPNWTVTCPAVSAQAFAVGEVSIWKPLWSVSPASLSATLRNWLWRAARRSSPRGLPAAGRAVRDHRPYIEHPR